MAATSASPSERNAGTFSPTARAILPSVSLPSSPYWAASGNSPAPTESMTMRTTRDRGIDELSGLNIDRF